MEDNENNQDFSELIEYLDGKFIAIDDRFDDISQKFGDIKKDFNDLQSSVDTYAKKADTYFQEMVMLSHKVDRHEKWFHLLADKLGVKLDY